MYLVTVKMKNRDEVNYYADYAWAKELADRLNDTAPEAFVNVYGLVIRRDDISVVLIEECEQIERALDWSFAMQDDNNTESGVKGGSDHE